MGRFLQASLLFSFLLFGYSVFADSEFENWKREFREFAIAQGISATTVDTAFRGLLPDPKIIENDSSQSEFVKPIWKYLESAISEKRLSTAKAMLQEHAELLKKIEQQQAVEAYYQQIQRHTERLLQKYQRFSEAAQRHVALQQQLVDTTTALYEGYQSMYHDLKRIMGMSNLAVIMTLGVVDASGAGWQPVGGIGVALRTWQASYRFGRRYRGVEVGLRWPLGF